MVAGIVGRNTYLNVSSSFYFSSVVISNLLQILFYMLLYFLNLPVDVTLWIININKFKYIE